MKNLIPIYYLLGLFSLTLIFSCQRNLDTQVETELSTKIDSIFQKWDNSSSPGVAVAIIKNGKTIFKKGYGMANLEHDIPISPASVFDIASESKQFAIFCIILLESQGKLSLDDDIRKYLTEFPDYGKKITIKNLIYHTSGLRDYLQLHAISGTRLDDVIKPDHILKLVNNQQQINFDPGERHLYSNTGYILLGEIVRVVSGQSLREFAENEIFKPIGMKDTHFHDNYRELVINRVNSYSAIDSVTFENSIISYSIPGATALFTTAEDEIKWLNNYFTMGIGEKEVYERMHELAVLNSGDTITYAGGLNIDKYKGWQRIGHGGSSGGFKTYTVRFPDENLGIVVFSNVSDFNPNGMAMKIADIFLEDKSKIKDSIIIDHQIFKNKVGKYLSDEGLLLELVDSSKLYLKSSTSLTELIPISATTFTFNSGYGIVRFSKDDNSSFERIYYDEKQILNKYEPTVLSQTDMENYQGIYVSEEVNTRYEIIVNEDILILKHYKYEDAQINALTSDQFSSSHWWMRNLIFQRDEEGEIIGFEVNSGRVLHLSFKKL